MKYSLLDRLMRFPVLAAMLATLALLSELTSFDRWLLLQFADPAGGGFPARHAFWAEQVLHRGGIWLVSAVAAAALAWLLGASLSQRLRPYWREAAYVLTCIALTTGVVALLKQTTGMDCPWDMALYGGDRPYVHLFAWRPLGAAVGHCFPGGHSSGAFSLVAVAVVLAWHKRREAGTVLVASLVLGLCYAATQWLRGAHFPSHDLWSAFIAWCVACGMAPLMLPVATRRLATAGVKPTVLAFPRLASKGAVTTGLATLLALLGLIAPATARAEAAPPIVEIEFRGNDVTHRSVMEREIFVAVGDPAEARAIERSRQAIQDLGLFRRVHAQQEPVADGVRLVFVVEEKWYLLAYPRLSANSDGQNALGAELRWNNLWGRNHSLRALVSSADRKEEGRGRQFSYLASYQAPFVLNSPYTLAVSATDATTPIDDGVAYDETVDEFQVLLSRKIGDRGSASQGWSAGAGLRWQRQTTSGDFAPEPYGDAYALVTRIDYRDVRDRIYSDVGTSFGTRFEIADQNVGSDYSFSSLSAEYRRALPLGDTPHQTVEFAVEGGTYNNGPADGRDVYALGGTSGLRGYKRESFEGDFYYLASATYLRPLYWDWLRLSAGIEAGNAFHEADDLSTNVRWSVNLGLRVRATRLVNFEFELGVAMPLDNDGMRFYGSRNGF